MPLVLHPKQTNKQTS